jgi:hypothetical protein
MKNLKNIIAGLVMAGVFAFGPTMANAGIIITNFKDTETTTKTTNCTESVAKDGKGIIITNIVGIIITNLTGIIITNAVDAPVECGIIITN